MCLLQANRTADLVHKLMNIFDDPKLKQEVMIRTLENTIIHIYGNIANSGQYVSAVTVAAIGTSTVCIAALK